MRALFTRRQPGANITSSEKTGKYAQVGTPGTSNKTYQFNQESNKYIGVDITAAKLKNADGKYTETANASAGQTIPYCTCPTCGGKWLKDFAAIIDSTDKHMEDYPTLQKAVDAYNKLADSTASKNYIQMLHSTTGDSTTGNVNTNKDLYLDLNGCTVTGTFTMNSKTLYGMDSATDQYDDTSAGKIVGTVTGTVAPVFKTNLKANKDYEYHRYVSIQSENSYSFHRFNISVTGYRFELAAPQCALFFIGEFQGDDAAKAYLSKLGFTLKGEDGRQLGTDSSSIPPNPKDIPDMPDDGKESTSEVVRTKDGAFLFEAYLMRSFDKGNRNGYTEKIKAIAQATFKNNVETQDSEPKQWSFEDAWKNPGDLTSKQQEILDNFLQKLGITKQAE